MRHLFYKDINTKRQRRTLPGTLPSGTNKTKDEPLEGKHKGDSKDVKNKSATKVAEVKQ